MQTKKDSSMGSEELSANKSTQIIIPGDILYTKFAYATTINSLYIFKLLQKYISSRNLHLQNTCCDLKHTNCNTLLLIIAIRFNAINIVKHLLKSGTNPNCFQTEFRYTRPCAIVYCSPLHYAVEGQRFEIAKLLLENGADCNLPAKRNHDPLLPLLSAYLNRDDEMIALLISYGANVYSNLEFFLAFSSIIDKPKRNKLFPEVTERKNLTRMIFESQNLNCNLLSKKYDINDYYENVPSSFALALETKNADVQFLKFVYLNKQMCDLLVLFQMRNETKSLFYENYFPVDLFQVVLEYVVICIMLNDV